jgi:hypothetical protein
MFQKKLGVWNCKFFMSSVMISTFNIIDILYDSILSKKINVNLMNKQEFYSMSILFWLFDNLIVLWPKIMFLQGEI